MRDDRRNLIAGRRVRCLIIVPSLKRAGAETQAVELANGLAARGHQVHLCTFESDVSLYPELCDAVALHHVPRRRKYDPHLVRRIAGIIDSERIEIVVGVMQFCALIAALASKLSTARPKIVAAIHTTKNVGAKEELLDDIVYRRLLRRVQVVIFVCSHQREYWLERYPELSARAHVVYNGINVERYSQAEVENDARRLRSTLGIPESAFLFGCVAGFRREKGHLVLLDAFRRLPADAHLLLAGDGIERERIEAAVSALGLTDRVHLLGVVQDVRPVIAACNATVLASTAVETFSIAMLESMALGVPLVASAIGGLPEAIQHDVTGLLCQPGEVVDLAARMRYMVDHRPKTASMGEAARRLVMSRFTSSTMVASTETLLLEALDVTAAG